MKISYPDYQNSIMNLSNSILKHYKVETHYDSIKELDEVLNKNYKHIFMIVLDGMGVNLISNALPKNAFVNKYMKKQITSVFPPTTVAATTSLLTGLPPIVHGHLGWVQYFKEVDANVVVFTNQDMYDPNNIIKENMKEKHLSFESILDKIKKVNHDIHVHEIFPDFRMDGFKSFYDQLVRATEISKQKQKSFSYIYWTNPDKSEHIYGIDSKETKTVMETLSEQLDDFVSNLDNDSLVIVTADHGLVNVEEIDLFSNKELMDTLVRKPSIELRACNFFVKEDRMKDFVGIFNRHYSNKFLLLTKEELYSEQLLGKTIPNFADNHPKLEEFIGDYIAIAIDKYLFKMSYDIVHLGHHAGLTTGEMMVPLIVYEKK